MSKIKDFAHDFLEQSYELDLGYDWDNIPDLSYWSWIKSKKIPIDKYKEQYAKDRE